jgi:hypothetical protein
MIAVDWSETSLYSEDDLVLSMGVSQGNITDRSQIKRIAVMKQQGSVRMLLSGQHTRYIDPDIAATTTT